MSATETLPSGWIRGELLAHLREVHAFVGVAAGMTDAAIDEAHREDHRSHVLAHARAKLVGPGSGPDLTREVK